MSFLFLIFKWGVFFLQSLQGFIFERPYWSHCSLECKPTTDLYEKWKILLEKSLFCRWLVEWTLSTRPSHRRQQAQRMCCATSIFRWRCTSHIRCKARASTPATRYRYSGSWCRDVLECVSTSKFAEFGQAIMRSPNSPPSCVGHVRIRHF